MANELFAPKEVITQRPSARSRKAGRVSAAGKQQQQQHGDKNESTSCKEPAASGTSPRSVTSRCRYKSATGRCSQSIRCRSFNQFKPKLRKIEMAALNPVSETLYEYGVDLISALQSS
jgi:hypothetical protein